VVCSPAASDGRLSSRTHDLGRNRIPPSIPGNEAYTSALGSYVGIAFRLQTLCGW
jgi:hypothetical protein